MVGIGGVRTPSISLRMGCLQIGQMLVPWLLSDDMESP